LGHPCLGTGEGHVFIVDKLFIEGIALIFIAFSKDAGYGIDALRNLWVQNKRLANNPELQTAGSTRREALKNLATLPVLGVMGWGALNIRKKHGVDVMSGATIQVHSAALNELKGELPKGKIGQHEISRLVLGGNLIGGWAHARDLIYVPSLFKAYNTEKKVYETMMLAENAGIDTINIGFPSFPLMVKYKKMTGSKIKIISQVAPNKETGDLYDQINQAIDYGVDIMQIQGNWCDWLVRDQRLDDLVKMLDKIREPRIYRWIGCTYHRFVYYLRRERDHSRLLHEDHAPRQLLVGTSTREPCAI
jgi:hypothetical protein